MKYIVVRLVNFDDFIKAVNDYIGKSWRPQGGIAVDGSYYLQAMVLG